MILIVPCCGESERFNGVKKQFLIHPNGQPLPMFSASGIAGVDKIVYTFVFSDFYINYARPHLRLFEQQSNVLLLGQQTSSQVETIANTINALGLYTTPIYIKDCDNYFECHAAPNTVATIDINTHKCDYSNKSYSQTKENGCITRIAERKIISFNMNVGGYGFERGSTFLKYCSNKKFVSEVIQAAVNVDCKQFSIAPVNNYIDYGTQNDWDNYLKTILIK